MSCSNCFNGCTEITPDKCVKYTGTAIPELGIQTGDTLEFVEQALANFLISALDGSGIKPTVDLEGICNLVTQYIPTCSNCNGPSLNDLLQALMLAACDLQTQVDNTNTSINTLEGEYNTDCLTIAENTTSNTHNVLQAVITKLCEVSSNLEELTAIVSTLPTSEDVVNIINAYLTEIGIIGGSVKYYTRMVPYVAVEFYPTNEILANFSVTGVGSGDWEKIYFCNGLNGTPDKRGVVAVGLTNGSMGGDTMPSRVNPSISGNPTYALNTVTGTNFVTLQVPEMPQHSHVAVAISVADPHDHDSIEFSPNLIGNSSVGTGIPILGRGVNSNDPSTSPALKTSTEVVIVNTSVSLETSGENEAHTNTQPTIGCYYIMYIP